jgi:hypothetical protein
MMARLPEDGSAVAELRWSGENRAGDLDFLGRDVGGESGRGEREG